jgi:hypothetical protein
MDKINLDFTGVEKNQANFMLEAMFKSSDNNARICFQIIFGLNDKLDLDLPWDHIKAFASLIELPRTLRHLLDISKASEECKKILMAELDFDVFQSEYQHILDLFYPGWQYDNPRELLNKILEFSESFGVPRVKLRLLLEIAAYAEVFDPDSLDVIWNVGDEVEKTLQIMPESTLEQLNGRWFYAKRVEDLRDFIENC